LFDGVQLNDAQNGQIDLSKFNLNNVQEIAVYNGQPANLLQPARSFASASVLSIKTIQPALTLQKPYQIQAGVKGGSFGLVNPYLQWQQRINKQWSFIANANYIYANGRYKYKVDGDGSDTLAIRRNGDVRSCKQMPPCILGKKRQQ
jgi:vitamin B12 transporter